MSWLENTYRQKQGVTKYVTQMILRIYELCDIKQFVQNMS